MIMRRAMEMDGSLAMPPRLRLRLISESTPNRPNSSYAIAFRFTLRQVSILKLGNKWHSPHDYGRAGQGGVTLAKALRDNNKLLVGVGTVS